MASAEQSTVNIPNEQSGKSKIRQVIGASSAGTVFIILFYLHLIKQSATINYFFARMPIQ